MSFDEGIDKALLGTNFWDSDAKARLREDPNYFFKNPDEAPGAGRYVGNFFGAAIPNIAASLGAGLVLGLSGKPKDSIEEFTNTVTNLGYIPQALIAAKNMKATYDAREQADRATRLELEQMRQLKDTVRDLRQEFGELKQDPHGTLDKYKQKAVNAISNLKQQDMLNAVDRIKLTKQDVSDLSNLTYLR